jgi:predicted Zn-dependent peptidase
MRTEMSPFGKLYETFVSTAFQAHPYGHAVIGHRADILNYSREKVSEFYHSKYSTHNTVLCLVGGFDPAKAKEIITNYFSKLPATPAPPEPHTHEPAQEGERRVDVEFAAQPLILMGWHVPERNHPDTPALTVLSQIASSGRASRFYTKLVKTRTALSCSAWVGPGERYPRLFVAEATPSEGTSLEQMEQALLEEVEALKRDAPTPEELQRVVTGWRASLLRDLKSNQRMGVDLADHEAIGGDWHKLFTEIDAVARVTPEQVVAVARRYLIKNNRTVARLVPNDTETPTILGVPAEPPKPETKKEEK